MGPLIFGDPQISQGLLGPCLGLWVLEGGPSKFHDQKAPRPPVRTPTCASHPEQLFAVSPGITIQKSEVWLAGMGTEIDVDVGLTYIHTCDYMYI